MSVVLKSQHDIHLYKDIVSENYIVIFGKRALYNVSVENLQDNIM